MPSQIHGKDIITPQGILEVPKSEIICFLLKSLDSAALNLSN
jgi:hypothetical protein